MDTDNEIAAYNYALSRAIEATRNEGKALGEPAIAEAIVRAITKLVMKTAEEA